MNKQKFKSIFALLLAFTMVFSSVMYMLPVGAIEVKAAGEEDSLILHYEFKEASATAGTIVEDSSGKGNHGTIKGNGASIANGELTLPGGGSSSSAAYVQLPTGMFDNQNTLTISVWFKNQTGSGNYSGMFFGTTESYPRQYWLLNPKNPDGRFKSVVTNGLSTGSPWSTEYGISPTNSSQGIPGPVTDSNWGHYVTIITENSISAFYNGKKIGTVDVSRKVSDFGTNLVAYIGKSSYADIFYKGSVRDLKVYTTALSDEAVIREYYHNLRDEAKTMSALQEAKEALSLGVTQIVEDILLPVQGINATDIQWESSDPAYITNEGKVTRPKSGEGNKPVVLTATLSLGEYTITKEFAVTVMEDSAQSTLEAIKEKFEIGFYYLKEDVTLPATAGKGTTVKWTSSNPSLIDNDGNLTRPESGEGDQKITLTATISLDGHSVTKDFTVTVAEKGYAYLMTYVRKGNMERTDSLHLAYSTDGRNYEAFNNNSPVHFTKLGSKKIGSPVIFRKADGTFGLIATDDNANRYVIVADSEDLTSFKNERYVGLNNKNMTVTSLECYYDSEDEVYNIYWTSTDGNLYLTTTADFKSFSQPEKMPYQQTTIAVDSLPEGAIENSVIALREEEFDKVFGRYGRGVNIGITYEQEIKLNIGDTLEMPESVIANYSDGTTREMNVVWNQQQLAQIDTHQAGTYVVSGTVKPMEYLETPLVEQRADPWVIKGDDGYYYFTGSYPVRGDSDPEGYDRVVLRKSETIEGLATAEEVTIWHQATSDKQFRYIWAPELHNINGTWYVFCTASRSANNVWDIRPHILGCTKGDKDPMNPNNWEMIGEVQRVPGDSAFTTFSLDMDYFESDGQHYLMWAEKPNNISNIYLATIEPEAPWQLTSKAMLLTTPQYSWEMKGGTIINEGSAVFKKDGKIYVTFSAAAVDESYCVGLMVADEGSNLMDINSWTKYSYPFLTTYDLEEQHGPGHNSFTVDSYGNLVIMYHARPTDCAEERCAYSSSSDLNDPCRHARVKGVYFTPDGTPIFNMTPEQVLAEEFRTVTVTVTVEPAEYMEDLTIETSFNRETLEADATLDAYVKVTNHTLAEGPVLAIVALYDGSNRMVNLSFISKVIPVGHTEKLNAGFKLPSNITGHRVEVFVWDGDSLNTTNMNPLSNVVTLQ